MTLSNVWWFFCCFCGKMATLLNETTNYKSLIKRPSSREEAEQRFLHEIAWSEWSFRIDLRRSKIPCENFVSCYTFLSQDLGASRMCQPNDDELPMFVCNRKQGWWLLETPKQPWEERQFEDAILPTLILRWILSKLLSIWGSSQMKRWEEETGDENLFLV